MWGACWGLLRLMPAAVADTDTAPPPARPVAAAGAARRLDGAWWLVPCAAAVAAAAAAPFRLLPSEASLAPCRLRLLLHCTVPAALVVLLPPAEDGVTPQPAAPPASSSAAALHACGCACFTLLRSCAAGRLRPSLRACWCCCCFMRLSASFAAARLGRRRTSWGHSGSK